MPVILNTAGSPARGGTGCIEIGLLNNLGDAGMEAGERQLVDLLEAACGGARLRLRLFSLPSISRGAAARARMAGLYHGLETLLAHHLDGLFVTGAEPRAGDLREEAFWPELTRVVDWARTGTRSTIWSCLAAHAAVLHLDGIVRRPLADKCSGVFAVSATGDHPLLAGAGRGLQVCHSRWNGLDEAELVAAGYEVLTRGSIGVDSFVRREGSLFVFLQGHPEYDAGALGREARRDLARWQADPTRPPSLPTNYFSAEDEAALRAHVTAGHAETTVPVIGPPPQWRRDFAVGLVRNWLVLLGENETREAGRGKDVVCPGRSEGEDTGAIIRAGKVLFPKAAMASGFACGAPE